MTIHDFICEMDKLYPKTLSAEWDMDGLQCCADPDKELCRVLVALDATEKEIGCAIDGGYDLLLTHHPMIFGKAGDIVPDKLYGGRIIKLLSAGVGAASFHTRFDGGENGVNDYLASALGLTSIVPFGDSELPSCGRIGELTTSMSAADFAAFVKVRLGAPSVTLTGGGNVNTVAVLGGAGKDFVIPAAMSGADAIVTGEVSYNSALDLAESGIIIVEAGHYYTEFPACQRLAELVRTVAGAEADVYDNTAQKMI